ncbi:MAG: undecaprenyl-diphosphate phosphatase [Bdellovibrionota bacterium]
MSTYQSVIYALLHGFCEILPVGGTMVRSFVSQVFDWPEPQGALLGVLYLATALACFGHFRDDWASMTSSLIRVVLYRRRPMTVDERMPFIVTLATLPGLVAFQYLQIPVQAAFAAFSPLLLWGIYVGLSFPLLLVEYMGRKSKRSVDWNILDSVMVGISYLLWFVPGSGRTETILLGSLFRNYNREAALKFGFYCAFPVLLTVSFPLLGTLDFSNRAQAQEGVSWMSLAVAFFASFFSAWLAVGGLVKRARKAGFGIYWITRILFGIGAAGFLWFRANR